MVLPHHWISCLRQLKKDASKCKKNSKGNKGKGRSPKEAKSKEVKVPKETGRKLSLIHI